MAAIIEDYASIAAGPRVIPIPGLCHQRMGGTLPACWCYKAGAAGGHLPCPDARPQVHKDAALNETREAYRRLYGDPFWRNPR
jgi:hypothetical protein